MALFEIFNDADEFDDSNPDSGQVTVATESQIEITIGTITLDLYGSFAYDALGELTGGIFNIFEFYDYAHGGLQARLSGLEVGVDIFESAAMSPDPDFMDKALLGGADTIVGSAGDDSLDGFAGADSILGGAGNDTLNGGDETFPTNADTLAGGAGNDTYILGSESNDDVVVESAGGGVDTVVWSSSVADYTLGANIENLTLDGNSYQRGIGNELNNDLVANNNACKLDGLAGNDTLVGGFYVYETLSGGSGDDMYVLNGADATIVHEDADAGTDTIRSMVSAGLPDNVENLILLGSATFGAGNALANVITGNNLGDTLDGWTGADTLIGGTGDDTFKIDQAGDVVVGNGGNDTVIAAFGGYVMPDGIKALTFSGVDATGNASDNYIAAESFFYVRNVIEGLAGNDTIDGGNDSDVIDGGDGIDHSVYAGSMSNYTITHSGPDVIVAMKLDPYQDTLQNVERVDFADFSVAFDINGNAGEAYRLYQAAFNRKPDIGGLGYQMHDLDTGVTLEQVASNFIASPEFQRTYGNVDNTQFLTLLYNNVLHRDPDTGGLQFHLDEFAHGQSRATMLIHFSESPENQANVIGDINNGMVYTF